MPLHNVVPDLALVDIRELNGHELVIEGGERDAEGGGDDDVGPASDKFRVQVVQVVLEARLHDCLEGLLGEDEGVLVVTVELDLIDLLHFVESLHLVGLMNRSNVGFFLVTFVLTVDFVFLRCSDIWVDLIEHLFLEQNISAFKYLVLTGGDVGHARIDHNFLLDRIYVAQRIHRLCVIEVLAKIVIYLDLIPLVCIDPALVRLDGSTGILLRYHRASHGTLRSRLLRPIIPILIRHYR